MYNHITLKELRPKLPQVIASVVANLERFIVSKLGKPMAVILSLEDYESMIETLNETTDCENIKNIKRGMKESREGRTIDWQKIKDKHRL